MSAFETFPQTSPRPQVTADNWNSGVSGNWTKGSDWSTGSAPTSSSAATIAASGTYTVTINSSVAAYSLTINDAHATVADTSGGTLTISTTLTITAGTFSLGSGSTLSGGTVSLGSSGVFTAAGGTLNGVTYQGVLNLSAANAVLYGMGNLTFEGTGGTGAGTINLTGDGAVLLYSSSGTINGATINIGSSGYSYLDGESGTLTLGSGTSLVQAGSEADLGGYTGAETFVNLGSITAGYAAGYFGVDGPGLTNAGTIAVSNGDTFDMSGLSSFTNMGTITATGTGTVVNFGGTWSNSGSISVSNSALLNLGGSFSTGSFTGITATSGAAIAITGDMTNTGYTLVVGTASISLSGTITGGAVQNPGGDGIIAAGGTLSGVTYLGALNLTAQSALLYATGAMVFEGAQGTGAGTINLTGIDAALLYLGTGTLNNVTINIGGANASYLDGESGTLTLGSGTSLVQAGSEADLGGYTGAETFVNLGSITAGYAAGYFGVDGPGLTNAGTIAVSNGDTFDMSGLSSFTNTGTITATGTGTVVNFNGTWTNSGSIRGSSDALLNLGGSFSTSALSGLTLATGAAVEISGDLTNTGATLSVGTGSALGAVELSGTITGGTIADAGGGLVADGGTLSGVTYQGVLNLSAASALVCAQGTVTFEGAGGTGAGTINLTGIDAALLYLGTGTLNNVTINIGNGAGNYLDGESGTLTLGSGTSLVQAGSQAYLGGYTGAETFVNLGTITAGYNGGTFYIAGPSFTNSGKIAVSNGDTVYIGSTTWTNSGTISVGSNALLNLGGSFSLTSLSSITDNGGAVAITGTLTNTGGTLSVGTGSALGAVSLSGTIIGGTIADGGGGIIADYGTLNGVMYQGVLNMSPDNALLYAQGTLTFEGTGGSGPGTINLTGNGAALIYSSSGTLNNVTIDIGSASGSYLDGNSGTLTLGSGTSLVQAGAAAYLGDYYNGETFVNQGTIAAGYSGGGFDIAGPSFTNSGKIVVSNGDVLSLTALTAFTNLRNSTLTGGSYEVDAGSTFQLVNNVTIVTDAATIILSGAGSVIQSLNTTTNKEVTIDQKLVTIASGGTLKLLAGRNFTASGAFTDNGLLQLGGVTFTAASGLTISSTGSLSGYGTVSGAVADAGSISASGGTLGFSGAVSGTGALAAAAGAIVDLTTGGALTETISGAGTLKLDGTTAYTLAAGATSSIADVQIDAGATLSGAGTLGGAVSDAGTLSATSGTFVVDGAVTGAGVLTAASGAILDLAGGGSFTGAINGAGTLRLDGGNAFTLQTGATLSIAAVVVDAGAILDLTQGGSLAGNISGAGTLQLDGSTAYTLAGATLGIAALTLDTGVTVSGHGSIASAVANGGTIVASGGKLVLSGQVTGSGVLQAATSSVLDLTSGETLNEAVSGAGTLELGSTFLLGSGALSVSTISIDAGASLSGAGTLTSIADAGTLAAAGGTLTVNGAVSGAGTLTAGSGAVLNLAGGGSFSGNLGGLGTVDIAKALTLNAGASLTAATIDEAAKVTLGASTALSLAAGAALDITAASGATVEMSGPTTASLTNNGSIAGNGAGTAELDVAVINNANVSVGSGTLSFLSTLTNNGTIDASAGTLSVKDTVGGTGTLQIGATGTMSLLLGVGTGQTADFLASTGLLDLTKPIDFKGVISGFGGSDVIDLLKAPETSYSFSNNVLTIKNGSTKEASLHFSSGYTLADFSVTSDLNGGTFVKFV